MNTFEERLKMLLDQRASSDELFAIAYKKEAKSFKQCCDYILSVMRKRGSAVGCTDEEVVGLAVHYYDEDNLKVDSLPKNTRVQTSTAPEVKVELTDEDIAEAKKRALEREIEKQRETLHKPKAKAKAKKAEQEVLPSLFD